MAEDRRGWFARWRGARRERRYLRIRERELVAQRLEDEGRFAELAETLGEIRRDYAKQTRIEGHTRDALNTWIWRCDALLRAGLVDQAKLEMTVLGNLIVEYEGPNGELAGKLRETVAAHGGTGETGG